MTLLDWTDRRLDDMAATVRTNDVRLDKTQEMAQATQHEVVTLREDFDQHRAEMAVGRGNRLMVYGIAATWIASLAALGSVAVALLR